MRGLRGRTIPSGGIENRFKSLPKSKVTELSDSEMLTFLQELADIKRTDAINEFDPIAKQGLVDDAAKIELVAERLSSAIGV